MFNKLKTWYNGLNKERVAFIIFWTVVALIFVYFIVASAMRRKEEPQQEETYVYEDTVFALGVYNNEAARCTEIVFANEHYLRQHVSMDEHHSDFNDPVYVETGDLCVIEVEVKGDKEKVTLIKNLTKESLSELGYDREDDWPDLD